MNEELNYWEELVARIRGWDRMEHNWACSNEKMEHENLKTKESFIKELMRDYELKRK